MAPITRHKIGLQHTPPALVLYYSRDGNQGSLRKRVMPVRSVEELGAKASAKLLVEAHAEYLDSRYVEFAQILGLCEKLAAMPPAAPPSSQPGKSTSSAKPSSTPKALDRGLLREMELDFNSSGSEQSPPAEPVVASNTSAPQGRGRAGGLPPPSAVPSATRVAVQGSSAAKATGSPRKASKDEDGGAKAKQKTSAAKGGDAKDGKEKKGGGKKAKKPKKSAAAGNDWDGPSLNSLLGMSDDEAPAAPPPKRGSMISLAGMPSLF